MGTERRTPGPGRNVAILRKERDLSQAMLARKAGVSASLLSKIEVGDRALSQGVAAALGHAMGGTLDEVLGQARIEHRDEGNVAELRAAIRRFDLPGEPPESQDVVARGVVEVKKLVRAADLTGLIDRLPEVLAAATNHAHAVGSPEAWDLLTGVYGAAYYLAARHRWMDLAELAVVRQKLAAERGTRLATAAAARDEAGTFLNSGDFAGGLAVVDRAIVQVESILEGRGQAFALGLLHLRGMTLAGRLRDGVEVERHLEAAWRAAAEFPADVVNGYGIFGHENTAIHAVATYADLERHRDSAGLADELGRRMLTLPPTRIANLHIDGARAKLALRDRDGALRSLVDAWKVAPQKVKVHPTGREVLRVLISLHQRSNPTLTKLAKRAGLDT